LTISDHAALALLCDAWDDYWKAGEAAEKHGLTIGVQTREGTALVKANPAVAMKADAWRRVQSGLSKFGLDPSSRANLSVTTPEKKNPFDVDPLPKTRMVFHKGELVVRFYKHREADQSQKEHHQPGQARV
jgi:P27 family predicted phage terminase small subunit